MYCKNCGNEIQEGAAICTHCGFAVGTGEHFCPNCGSSCEPGQAVCTSCGSPLNNDQKNAESVPAGARKSKLAAGLLAIFIGTLGIHNFYLGYTGKAVAQLLITLLSCGIGSVVTSIWALIEGIFYLTAHEGYTTDAKGIPLSD